ncbi:MAG: acetylglutamate kinase [Phycisphaerae bacterium]|nr:acetylglutamate kinase [Phycisphaerae bacterium]
MDEAIAKAQALIEALNYIRKFRGRIVVVKIGGAVMDTPAALDGLLADVVFMATVGMQPIVVHGGGKAISAAMAEAGLEVNFVQGQRYTDERALSVAEHVLVNRINAHIVETVVRSGSSAIGMHSLASCVLLAERLFLEGDEGQRIDIGLVGEVTKVQSQVLHALCQAGTIPVIAPIARDRSGGKLNVNADLAAGKIAAAVKAEKLVMVSDTHGVRTVADDPDSLAASLTEQQLRDLAESGVITAGMKPKVQACLEALAAGVGKAHIIDGRLDHSLLLEIYTDKGVGTEILK